MKSLSWLGCLMMLLLSNPVFAADVQPSPPAAASADSNKTPDTPAVTTAPATPRGNDQLILDSTLVTGNRELPKVMYIVPWKKAELGNLPGQPFNTLIDETLAPVDREVFRREVDYYLVIADKDRAEKDRAASAAGRQATPAADKK
jgi:hypothetical protein